MNTRFRHPVSGSQWIPTDSDPHARFYSSDRGITMSGSATRHRTGVWSTARLPGTTLSAAIMTTGPTNITVTSTANLRQIAPFHIQIEDEVLKVTAIAGTTLTVSRGQAGSMADMHPNTADVIPMPLDGQGFVELANGRFLLAGGACLGHKDEVVNNVWYSDDRGRTWNVLLGDAAGSMTRPERGHTFGFFTMMIGGTQYVYWLGGDPFAPTGDVFRSADGGATWSRISTACPTVNLALFMYGVLGGNIYVMGGQEKTGADLPIDDTSIVNDKVWVSTDEGVSWNQIMGATCPATVFGAQLGPLPELAGELWVCGSGRYNSAINELSNAVYKYDGNTTWTQRLADGHMDFPKTRYHSAVALNGNLWRFNGSALREMTGSPNVKFDRIGAGSDKITRSAGSWAADGIESGMVVVITGSANNDGAYPITVTATDELTVDVSARLPQTDGYAGGIQATAVDSDNASAHWSDDQGATWNPAFPSLPWGDTHAQAAIATFDGIYLTQGFQPGPLLFVIREHTGPLVSSWEDQGNGGKDLSQGTAGKKPIFDEHGFPSRPGLVFTLGQVLAMSAEIGLGSGFFEVWAVIRSLNYDTQFTNSPNPPCVILGNTGSSSWNNFGLNGSTLEYVQANAGYLHTTRGSGLNDDGIHLIRVLHEDDLDGPLGPLVPRVRLYIDGAQAGAEDTAVAFDGNYTGWNAVGAGFSAIAPESADSDFGEFIIGAVVVRTIGSPWGTTETNKMLEYMRNFG